MDNRTIQAAVKRGAKFLDKKRPSWFTKINTKNLNLESCELCVLGQLYATLDDPDGYARGLTVLNGKVAEDPERFGFSLDERFDADAYWERLTALWNAEIAARRRARREASRA